MDPPGKFPHLGGSLSAVLDYSTGASNTTVASAQVCTSFVLPAGADVRAGFDIGMVHLLSSCRFEEVRDSA